MGDLWVLLVVVVTVFVVVIAFTLLWDQDRGDR